jgi:gliding motility-associated-like protein
MLNRSFYLLILIFLFCFNSQLSAQISADADRVTYDSINDIRLKSDPIFVYYLTDDGVNRVGKLTAKIADSTNLNFKWYLYNEATHQFDLIKTDNNVSQSKRGECTQGGYKVVITSDHSNFDTTFYCQVFQKNFKISSAGVKSSQCDLMTLSAQIQFDEKYIYYNRFTGSSISLKDTEKSKLKVVWEDTPKSGSKIPNNVEPEFPAPTVPTVYVLTITDVVGSFSTSRTKRIDIDETSNNGSGDLYLKAVKAKFRASRNFIPSEETDSSGQAPLTVQFVDSSENAEIFEWRFYKQTGMRSSLGDSLLIPVVNTRLISDSVRYTFPCDSTNKDKELNGYDVFLMVKGPRYYEDGEEKRCVDSLRKEKYIQVTRTFMSENKEIPNVFTPNGDEKNDKFIFQKEQMPTSIKYFSIKIYNRWGNKIYEYEDNNGDWEGWDGETIGFGKAPAGVYFYSIIYEGWNGERKIRKGYVHLFREK